MIVYPLIALALAVAIFALVRTYRVEAKIDSDVTEVTRKDAAPWRRQVL